MTDFTCNHNIAQSFSVIMANAIMIKTLGALKLCNNRSFSFIIVLTLLKICSTGFKSGEYGGKILTNCAFLMY